jgi:hypothetical protein
VSEIKWISRTFLGRNPLISGISLFFSLLAGKNQLQTGSKRLRPPPSSLAISAIFVTRPIVPQYQRLVDGRPGNSVSPRWIVDAFGQIGRPSLGARFRFPLFRRGPESETGSKTCETGSNSSFGRLLRVSAELSTNLQAEEGLLISAVWSEPAPPTDPRSAAAGPPSA